MNISELQAELRHFAAERDWQPFHTPKNLSTALVVEAGELAEIFQWMTPEDSARAHLDPLTRARIGEEVADVLLYLLQVADRSQIDVRRAVKDKLARNAMRYPVKRAIARVSPPPAAQPGTHVLIDYENVQPTERDLRAMVPDATHVWVFHGPHQREIEQRFSFFGDQVTAVPISRTGKNALDFHLSFYLGYLASRNQTSAIVVVANDKGYGPMLEHAKAMGFAVRQHVPSAAAAKVIQTAKAAPTKTAAKKAVARKAAGTKRSADQIAQGAKARKVVVAPAVQKAAPVKMMTRSSGRPRTKGGTPSGSAGGSLPAAPSVSRPSVPADVIKRITDNLWKLGVKRPVKAASLRRALKSLLGAETGDESIEVAIGKLVEDGVILLGLSSDVSYPGFAAPTSTQSAKV